LKIDQQANLWRLFDRFSQKTARSEDASLGDEHYLVASVPLSDRGFPTVHLLVLKSYDQASGYIRRLNELIASLGLLVLLIGGILAVYLSGTITRPLETLVASVHALGSGNFDSKLPQGGTTEIRQLSSEFDLMRRQLRKTQQELLDAERLATIGEMASSISHDLRHHLSAVYANAEFLGYSRTTPAERVELLTEIQLAVQGMTELIDSLLLFSRTGRALQPTFESIPLLVDRAVSLIRAHPEAQGVNLTVNTSEQAETWIDAKKIERAIYNLLLNACQAARRGERVPAVSVSISETSEYVLVRIADNGAGVADSIRLTLFEPFVSKGKQSGIGLGLTLAQRIAREHGGDVSLDQDAMHTIFTLSVTKGARLAPDKANEDRHASPTSSIG
jgi:signal transduction histidine kinase